MKQMCEFQPRKTLTEAIPNWATFNSKYYSKYAYREFVTINGVRLKTDDTLNDKYDQSEPLKVYGCAIFKYCENCGAELYWPYIKISVKEKIRRLAKPKYEDSIAEELVHGVKKIEDHARIVEMEAAKVNTCPVCGNTFSHEKGFFEKSNYFLKIDADYKESKVSKSAKSTFSSMKRYREEVYKEIDEKTGKEHFEKDIYQINGEVCDLDVIPENNMDPERIKNATNTLCDYLTHAVELEKNIYMIEKRLQMLYVCLPRTQREAKLAVGKQKLFQSEKLDNEKQQFEKRVKEISNYSYGTFGLELLSLPEEPNAPACPIEPEYEKPSLLKKRKILEQNALLEQQYNDEVKRFKAAEEIYILELEEYKKQCAEVNKKNHETEKNLLIKKSELEDRAKEDYIAKINQIKESYHIDDKSLPEVQFEQIVTDELQLAKDTYKQLLIARRSYYLSDIIFEKYRNLAALSTIYEYLKSGRCTTLEGADGCYNLYESELRANLIISKLDIVLEKLEDIKNSQYVLCNVMQTINTNLLSIDKKFEDACSSLARISNNISAIKSNSESIQNNTAIIAYNTEKTAFYSKMTASISAAMLLWG